MAAGVPALLELPQPERDCAVADTYHQLRNHPDDWRRWSWGRAHARDRLDGQAPGYHPTCGFRG